jgi:hypothetical protein
MFYATDFLTHTHIGTGTVIDRMLNPFTLAGKARPVTRARHDWQVYDRVRHEKGGVRWHTVEGPAVLKRKGRYFEMFSGGNWQNVTYGVSYAVTDDIDADDEWHQHSDGITTLPILRTIPDRVIGPGHNSVIRGPNNRELYCVYHRWVGNERVLAIDRLDFAGDDRLIVSGPTDTPQLRPYVPHTWHNFRGPVAGDWQVIKGEWRTEDNELHSAAPDENEIRYATWSESFLAELYIRPSSEPAMRSGVKLQLAGNDDVKFLLDPAGHRVTLVAGETEQKTLDLPAQFDPTAFHHIRIEVDQRWVSIALDEVDVIVDAELSSAVTVVGLVASGVGSSFSAMSLTYGFEERFERNLLSQRGWAISGPGGEVTIDQQDLLINCEGGKSTRLSKPVNASDYELIVNVCPIRMGPEGSITFGSGSPVRLAGSSALELTVAGAGVALPDDRHGFFRQFRIVKIAEALDLYFDGQHIASTYDPARSSEIWLEVIDALAAVDMIRFTPL